ncbi:MAG: prepilin-type N-terminal cleavage/methylation domain-containing protein [Candidatus Omnitrophica bacterium]|nr:prepilin-type N-terminal cleavage/methylation domain-containing protein [Candidatus Omnitrophota bacterium]
MNARGFSLPELMVVSGIVALVGTVATVGVVRHRENAEDVRMQAELTSIYKAAQAFRQVYGRYPANNAELRPFISVPDFDNRYEINPNP